MQLGIVETRVYQETCCAAWKFINMTKAESQCGVEIYKHDKSGKSYNYEASPNAFIEFYDKGRT